MKQTLIIYAVLVFGAYGAGWYAMGYALDRAPSDIYNVEA